MSNLSTPRLQNSDRGLLSHNTALQNNELCGITVNPDNSLQNNANSIEDLVKHLTTLRFLNPNKDLRIRGKCKTDAGTVTYYIHSNNLTIFSMIIANHHYANTNFTKSLHFNEYVASCIQSEADDSLLNELGN
jgi:hypothetical protein